MISIRTFESQIRAKTLSLILEVLSSIVEILLAHYIFLKACELKFILLL